MKKFTVLAAMALAWTGFTAQAQLEDMSVYVAGEFNDFTPAGQAEWRLTEDEDAEGVFRGLVEIPAGEFQFNLQYMGYMNIVPSMDTSGVGVEENLNVVFDDGFFSGYVGVGQPNVCWVNEDWAGGDLEIVLDMNTMEITFSSEAAPEEVWFIRGPFNNYNPAGNPVWALEASTEPDENGVYSNAFAIPAGEFSINFLDPYGKVFIPASIDNEEIDFTDGVFVGNMDMAYDETEEAYCFTCTSWEGGEIVVTIDSNEGTVIITKVGGGDFVMAPFISGVFNEFDPAGNPEWMLQEDEDYEGFYRGYFEIPEGEFTFNIALPIGHLVPAIMIDGEPVATDDNMNVWFDEGFYSGMFSVSQIGNTYWTYDEWEGGEIEVGIDLNTGEIVITTDALAEVAPWYVRGQFNEFNPTGLPQWALHEKTLENGVVDNGVYTGTFVIPADQFSLNFLSPEGMVFIPGSNENETVSFTEGKYESSIALAYDEEDELIVWTAGEWAGGIVSITLDSNEGTLVIESEGELSYMEEAALDYPGGYYSSFAPFSATFTWGEEISLINPTLNDWGDEVGAAFVQLGTEPVLYPVSAAILYSLAGEEETEGEDFWGLDIALYELDDLWFFDGDEITVFLPEGIVRNNEGAVNKAQSFVFHIVPQYEGEYTVTPEVDYDTTLTLTDDLKLQVSFDGNAIEYLQSNVAARIYEPEYKEVVLAYGEETVIENEVLVIDLSSLTEGDWELVIPEGIVLVNVDGKDYLSPELWLNFSLEESEDSGVQAVVNDGETVVFNINGVRVDASNLQKGIYIVNGKKVVVTK